MRGRILGLSARRNADFPELLGDAGPENLIVGETFRRELKANFMDVGEFARASHLKGALQWREMGIHCAEHGSRRL